MHSKPDLRMISKTDYTYKTKTTLCTIVTKTLALATYFVRKAVYASSMRSDPFMTFAGHFQPQLDSCTFVGTVDGLENLAKNR